MSLNQGSARPDEPGSDEGYERLYDVLFEETHDFAFLLDSRGRVVEANSRVQAATGTAAGEITGTRLWNTAWFQHTSGRRHRLREDLQRAIGGEHVDRGFRMESGDSQVFVDVGIRPVLDPQGTVELLFVTGVETEVGSRVSDLVAEKESLEEFVRVVTHDVRHLLGVATGNLAVAAEDNDQAAFDQTRRSLERIEGLLDHVAATARDGKLIGDREECHLGAIADEAWQYAGTDEASLVIEDSTTVRADPVRLVEVFENFYRNVGDHAGPGVTVRVGTTADGFYVADDGPGLPSGLEPFEAGACGDPGGSGVGLSIVETVVNAHGWSIEATEAADGGARFDIETSLQ